MNPALVPLFFLIPFLFLFLFKLYQYVNKEDSHSPSIFELRLRQNYEELEALKAEILATDPKQEHPETARMLLKLRHTQERIEASIGKQS